MRRTEHLAANTLPLLILGGVICGRSKSEFVVVTVAGILWGGDMAVCQECLPYRRERADLLLFRLPRLARFLPPDIRNPLSLSPCVFWVTED